MGSTAMAEEQSTAKDVAQDDISNRCQRCETEFEEAIATKRGSDKILDSIAAEDMGKFLMKTSRSLCNVFLVFQLTVLAVAKWRHQWQYRWPTRWSICTNPWFTS